jgi:hypothetical protein
VREKKEENKRQANLGLELSLRCGKFGEIKTKQFASSRKNIFQT